jgi:hypothetical protein
MIQKLYRVETVKTNGLLPYVYLLYLFTKLPKVPIVEANETLLPGKIYKDQLTVRRIIPPIT